MSLHDREGIENYERRAFYDQVEIEKEEIISCLKTVVRVWTENEIDRGFDPWFSNFIDMHPEWSHEELHDTIIGEIKHAKHELSRARTIF